MPEKSELFHFFALLQGRGASSCCAPQPVKVPTEQGLNGRTELEALDQHYRKVCVVDVISKDTFAGNT